MKLFGAIVFVLLAFAGNSLLARIAMMDSHIDAISFTTIRLVSAAVILLCLVSWRQILAAISWRHGGLLWLYAIANTVAFIKLPTATGALVLFAMVQLTMLLLSQRRGEKLSAIGYMGALLALVGLGAFLLPKASIDNVAYIAAAIVAGVAWGAYSGAKQQASPVVSTAANFIVASAMILPLQIVLISQLSITLAGVLYAVGSGVITSALGYVLWYWVVRQISGGFAATVQLFAPVMAAILGWALMGEQLSLVSVAAGCVILLGIAIVASQKSRRAEENT
ncbi:DMT family transporter [Salinibius halmophilus]|uniref:DMT family transporter n=1 Tax=Salinibius halmophilus TaxID=1853216 RepID=UPI000E661A7D|nr:DMT family transporter [Salinibius halmophilus]